MSRKLDFVNDYISGFISENFPEFSRFKIEINENALYFQNVKDGYKDVLYVGLGHTNYPSEQVSHGGFHCWTEITVVEKLLLDLIVKHGLHVEQLFPTIRFNEFTNNNFNEIWDSFGQFRNYDLSTNEEKLNALCQHYKEMIIQYFTPFWEKYSNIQYVNDEIINKVFEEDLNNYLPGKGNLKKIIIMKICSNPNYNEYKQTLINLAGNAVLQDKDKYQPYENLLSELIEILETQY
ncbi:hypothetical protein GCM10022422_33860 [Flavobacterium ginsengisoli]|uniref:Uncharacterized protein n=1 Tax=Flavobacterium ginsengisoli TaxID=871694 RepID=A0ABP7FSK3_9FLAO|nr:hypothetical protein [Flavobacterium ginsengisoli]